MTAQAMPAGLAVQERAARTLEQALRNRSCHAFMLSGSPGTGTHEAATWIGQSVLCPDGGCGDCAVCRRVRRRVHPDFLWVGAEGVQLREAQVEQLIEQLVRTPFEATAQVAVIADADTLARTNETAANKLLKVLEEPPGDVVFVLLASSPGTVLPTIRSRVIEVPFPALSDDAMRRYIAAVGLDASSSGLGVEAIVRIARGDIGRAHDLAADGPAAKRHALVCSLASSIARGKIAPSEAAGQLLAVCEAARDAAVAAAEAEFAALREQLPKDEASRLKNQKDSEGHDARAKRRGRRAMSDALRSLLLELAGWYRDLMAVRAGAVDAVSYVDRLDDYHALANSPAALNAVAALDSLDEVLTRITTNVDFGTALMSTAAELVGLGEGRIRSRRTTGTSLV